MGDSCRPWAARPSLSSSGPHGDRLRADEEQKPTSRCACLRLAGPAFTTAASSFPHDLLRSLPPSCPTSYPHNFPPLAQPSLSSSPPLPISQHFSARYHHPALARPSRSFHDTLSILSFVDSCWTVLDGFGFYAKLRLSGRKPYARSTSSRHHSRPPRCLESCR